jgi:hypothetical protein
MPATSAGMTNQGPVMTAIDMTAVDMPAVDMAGAVHSAGAVN